MARQGCVEDGAEVWVETKRIRLQKKLEWTWKWLRMRDGVDVHGVCVCVCVEVVGIHVGVVWRCVRGRGCS